MISKRENPTKDLEKRVNILMDNLSDSKLPELVSKSLEVFNNIYREKDSINRSQK